MWQVRFKKVEKRRWIWWDGDGKVEIRCGMGKIGRMGFEITNQNGRVDNGSHTYRRGIWLETKHA